MNQKQQGTHLTDERRAASYSQQQHCQELLENVQLGEQFDKFGNDSSEIMNSSALIEYNDKYRKQNNNNQQIELKEYHHNQTKPKKVQTQSFDIEISINVIQLNANLLREEDLHTLKKEMESLYKEQALKLKNMMVQAEKGQSEQNVLKDGQEVLLKTEGAKAQNQSVIIQDDPQRKQLSELSSRLRAQKLRLSPEILSKVRFSSHKYSAQHQLANQKALSYNILQQEYIRHAQAEKKIHESEQRLNFQLLDNQQRRHEQQLKYSRKIHEEQQKSQNEQWRQFYELLRESQKQDQNYRENEFNEHLAQIENILLIKDQEEMNQYAQRINAQFKQSQQK